MSLEDPAYMRDPRHVREQYASEKNLAARSSLYVETTGLFAGDVAFAAVAEVWPSRFLEVGCGDGWFAARVRDELGAEVVAVDQSNRMIGLARGRSLDGHVADVQELPFDDGEFDCVAANWMLYHVPDLDRGLSEIARVLRVPGRLVAITNGKDHLLEMWRLVGFEQERMARDLAFGSENGEAALRRHFQEVEMRDAAGAVMIAEREAVVRYIASTKAWEHLVARVPESIEPFAARRSNVVFVADKAAA